MTERALIDELLDAVDFLGNADESGNVAILDTRSHKIYFVCDEMEFEEMNGVPEPDDLYEQTHYVDIPDARALGLGKSLALRFADQHLGDDSQTVSAIFSRRGAYSRFKGLLAERELLEKWYEYEKQARKVELIEWAELNDIPLEEDS
jgi:hypothetical protein